MIRRPQGLDTSAHPGDRSRDVLTGAVRTGAEEGPRDQLPFGVLQRRSVWFGADADTDGHKFGSGFRFQYQARPVWQHHFAEIGSPGATSPENQQYDNQESFFQSDSPNRLRVWVLVEAPPGPP
jgi:hypothetical protein